MRFLRHRKTDRPRAVNRRRHTDNAERSALHVVKGDTVRVVETRPLSRTKRWRLVEILERAR